MNTIAKESAQIEPLTERPLIMLGVMITVCGLVNMFLGLNNFLAQNLGGLIGGILDKVVCIGMVGVGIWAANKRITIDSDKVVFVGLIPGQSKLELPLKAITSVRFNSLKQLTEITTLGKTYSVGIKKESEAFQRLDALPK